jgi:uncharacterized heparinase superfamily protein
LTHQRRLYVSVDGNDIRGEDTFTGNRQGRISVRFHLHPAVSASLVQNAVAVLLRLPSGTAWRMQASGGQIETAESIYLGLSGEHRHAEQIVISSSLNGGDLKIKWAIKKILSA